MTRDEIIQQLRRIALEASVEQLDGDKINAESTIKSLGFDSLSILDLLYDLEQEFGVPLEAAEVMEIETVGAIADLLAERIEPS
jgi:acyl carrier protein